jgi:hypothetical protein
VPKPTTPRGAASIWSDRARWRLVKWPAPETDSAHGRLVLQVGRVKLEILGKVYVCSLDAHLVFGSTRRRSRVFFISPRGHGGSFPVPPPCKEAGSDAAQTSEPVSFSIESRARETSVNRQGSPELWGFSGLPRAVVTLPYRGLGCPESRLPGKPFGFSSGAVNQIFHEAAIC